MFVQVALHRILTSWGDTGLEQHIRAVQTVYWRRASTLHQAAVTVRRPGSCFPSPNCQPLSLSSVLCICMWNTSLHCTADWGIPAGGLIVRIRCCRQ